MIERGKNIVYKLLRWSEKFTKTDMVYFSKGGFWLTLERIISIAAGFGMSVAFANFLEPEKYGVYKYALSIISIAGAFTLVGMSTAVNQAVARGFDGALKTGFATMMRWTSGSVLVAFTAAIYYFANGNATLGIALLVGGACLPLIASAGLYDNFLSGKQNFRAKAFLGSLRNALPPIALVVVLIFTQDPVLLVATYFVMTALVTFYCYWETRLKYVKNNLRDTETLGFSKHLSFMNILSTLSAQADRVLAFSQIGGAALAIYSFAEAVPDQLRSLSNIIGTLAFPKITKTSYAVLKKTIPWKMLIIFLASSVLAGAYALVAPLFFSIFFPKYMEAVPYSQLYAAAIPFAMMNMLLSQVFLGHMKKKELYIKTIFPQVARIVLLVVLVYAYGILGIIIGTILFYVLSSATLLVLFYTSKDTGSHPAMSSSEDAQQS